MQNFSFLGHLEMPWNFFPMLNLSGLRGSSPRQQFWVSKFFSYSFRASVNQYTDFHVSTIPESALHHISSCDRGPWLRPWIEIFGLQNFSFGLVVNPITVRNFSFLGHLEVPEIFPPMLNLCGNHQAPLVPPLEENFGFSNFPL